MRTYRSGDGNLVRTPEQHFLDLVVDGRALRDRFDSANVITPLHRSTATDLLPGDVDMFLGRAQVPELDDGRIAVFVCLICGDIGCWGVSAGLTVAAGTVTWSAFRWENGTVGIVPVAELPAPIVFDRAAYESAFSGAAERVAAFPYDELAHHGRRVRWPWQWGWR